MAQWGEIDFDEAMWVIPWQRMKTRKITKKDHYVPLASQVINLLKELREFSGDMKKGFLYPSIRAKTDTISDAGPLNALRDMGYPKSGRGKDSAFGAAINTLTLVTVFGLDRITKSVI